MGLGNRRVGPVFVVVLVAIGAAGVAIAVWWISQRALERREINSLRASSALKAIYLAEKVFSSKDLDGNGIADFWTGDVAGLHRYGLIERNLAEADAKPLSPSAAPAPLAGYFFVSMDSDGSEAPPEILRQETDKEFGKVHHRTKFAFCAYPSQFDVTGRYVWIVNQDGQFWANRSFTGQPILKWPSQREIIRDWVRPE